MRTRRIDDTDLIARLTEVFRRHGFEGASLSRIAEATDLRRASLYHRYPGGKEDMAEAVLAHADACFRKHVLAPLLEDGSPARRVRAMAGRLRDYYDAGRQSCLLDALSIGDADGPLHDHVKASFAAWRRAMAAIAREAGASATDARRRADDALVGIQGSLVLARATGDRKPFDRVLNDLPQLLTGTRP